MIHDNTYNRINGAFLQLYRNDIAYADNLEIVIERNNVSGYGEAGDRTKPTYRDYFIRIDDTYNTYKGGNRRTILIKDNNLDLRDCGLINPKYSNVLVENNEIIFHGEKSVDAINVTQYSAKPLLGASNVSVRNNIIQLGTSTLFNNTAPTGDIIIEDNTITTDYAGDGKHVYSPYCIRTGAPYDSLVFFSNKVSGFSVFWMTVSSSHGDVVAVDNDVDVKWMMYTVFPQWFPKSKPLKATIKGNKLTERGVMNNTFNIELTKDSDIGVSNM